MPKKGVTGHPPTDPKKHRNPLPFPRQMSMVIIKRLRMKKLLFGVQITKKPKSRKNAKKYHENDTETDRNAVKTKPPRRPEQPNVFQW